MVIFLSILTGLSMLATLATLFAGMIGLVRGDSDASRSNTLMRWRVMLQGLTLGLFVLLLVAMKA